MQRIRVLNTKITPNPVERNKQVFIQVKLDEIERGLYARATGSSDIELYAGESMGKV